MFFGMLKSSIAQCCEKYPQTLSELRKLYDRRAKFHQQPPHRDLQAVMKSMFDQISETYVVNDGLDECQDQKQILGWIQDIMLCPHYQILSMIINRHECLIEKNHEPFSWRHISLNDNTDHVSADIKNYIDEQVVHDRDFSERPDSDKVMVKQMLTSKAKGM